MAGRRERPKEDRLMSRRRPRLSLFDGLNVKDLRWMKVLEK
jgi:hypothetical protein